MNSNTGEIYHFESDKARAVKQAELEQEQARLIELSKQQAELLEHFHPDERVELHRNLMSKNNAAKRRARNKIAKQSRRKNR